MMKIRDITTEEEEHVRGVFDEWRTKNEDSIGRYNVELGFDSDDCEWYIYVSFDEVEIWDSRTYEVPAKITSQALYNAVFKELWIVTLRLKALGLDVHPVKEMGDIVKESIDWSLTEEEFN